MITCAYQRCRMTVTQTHDYWERRDWFIDLGQGPGFETASRAHMIKNDDRLCPKAYAESLPMTNPNAFLEVELSTESSLL